MHELPRCDADDDIGYNDLYRAARDGNISRLKEALQPSLNVNALQGPTGLAPLHIAAVNGHVDAIHFLLKNGADVDLPSSNSETALNKAAFSAHTRAVRSLLDAGAQVDTQPRNDRNTVLYSVIQDEEYLSTQHIETIQLLLNRGFDVNAPMDLWGTQLVCAHQVTL